MENIIQTVLWSLKLSYEAQEDWVTVGHIEYLIDRLATEGNLDACGTSPQLYNLSIH